MTTFEKREIRRRLFSIYYTIAFLLISTFLWFGPRQAAVKKREMILNNSFALASNLDFKELTSPIDVNKQGSLSDEETSNIDSYQFVVKNSTDKTISYLISFKNKFSDDLDNCDYIPNNYIKYRIKKNNEDYSDIRSLSIDGRIYVDDLAKNDESIYSIQYWIDDEYKNMNNHYFNSQITLTSVNYFKS